MEERTFELIRGGDGWAIEVRNGQGQVHSTIPAPGTKKEAIQLIAELEAKYKYDYALDFLREVLPVGSMLTIVWKHDNPGHHLYNVFTVYDGQIIQLDPYIHDARVADYVYRRNKPSGIDAYGAGNLANAISSRIHNQPRAFRWVEVK